MSSAPGPPLGNCGISEALAAENNFRFLETRIAESCWKGVSTMGDSTNPHCPQMKLPPRALILSLASLLAFACESTATVVINNLPFGTQGFAESLSGPDGQDFFGDPFDNREIAFSFTTGGVDATLTEVAFLASVGGNGTSPIQLELSTGGAAPGGTNPVIFGAATPTGSVPVTQLLTVTPGSPVQLLANTQYWMRFTVPVGTDVYSIQNTNTPTLTTGWSLGTTWRSEQGLPWEEINSALSPRVRLTAVEAVPEPGTLLISTSSLLLLFRRKRSSNPGNL